MSCHNVCRQTNAGRKPCPSNCCVNRVFKDKPHVDWYRLYRYCATTEGGACDLHGAKGKGRPTIDSSEALRILQEKLQIARDQLHPVDWSAFETNALQLIPECMDHILGLEDGKNAIAILFFK